MKRNSPILGSAAQAAEHRAASPQKMQGKLRRTGAMCLAVSGMIALSACGQKGPLYLPAPNTGTPSTLVAPAAK